MTKTACYSFPQFYSLEAQLEISTNSSFFFFFPRSLFPPLHLKFILNVSFFGIKANIFSDGTLTIEQLFWWLLCFVFSHAMMFAHSCSSPGQSMFNNIWRDALRSAQACSLQTIRVLLLACSRARDVGAGATGQGHRAGWRVVGSPGRQQASRAAAPAWAAAEASPPAPLCPLAGEVAAGIYSCTQGCCWGRGTHQRAGGQQTPTR